MVTKFVVRLLTFITSFNLTQSGNAKKAENDTCGTANWKPLHAYPRIIENFSLAILVNEEF